MSKIRMPRDGMYYEPMTKTVPQSLKALHADMEATDSRNAQLLVVDYQPGNGTRYILTLIRLPYGAPREEMGARSDATHMMVLHNIGTRRAVFVGPNTQYYDLNEKLGIGNADCLTLCVLARYMSGDWDNLTFEGGVSTSSMV